MVYKKKKQIMEHIYGCFLKSASSMKGGSRGYVWQNKLIMPQVMTVATRSN